MSITANLKKTYYYCKKNGIVDTYYALRERLYARTSPLYMAGYDYVPVSEEELQKQRETVFENAIKFSILVPMYETKPEFAREMVDSVLAQTYTNWELILADASKTDLVKDVVSGADGSASSMGNVYASDSRIRYVRIVENKGISENTNEALKYATGDYIGLLDHDDLLTPDALYEMALAIKTAGESSKTVAFAYSDEDKCDAEAKRYYEPHVKSGFNLDLLFSNNYICHFLVMKADLMKKTGFRKEYDGAQDFDLVLRAFLHKEPADEILHVNKVLYHWRCHESSTAANPQSKLYAYEAGKRAVESALEEYLREMHDGNITKVDRMLYVNDIPVQVVHTKHNGFYRVEYGKGTAEDIFKVRKDIGVIAGPVIDNNKITSGIVEKDGTCPYAGLPAKISGYIHRLALQQNPECVDVRNAAVRFELAEEIKNRNNGQQKLNLDLIQDIGNYKILYDPYFVK
ncbi:MAG: glycosyltransferase [Lachnospiraceae bacterium]|nr:glycosyltransferase [Lachnospiraceae bacterium]